MFILVEVFADEDCDFVEFNVQLPILGFKMISDTVEIVLEYLPCVIEAQGLVEETKVDTRSEGLVKVTHSVGCKKKDAGIILKNT